MSILEFAVYGRELVIGELSRTLGSTVSGSTCSKAKFSVLRMVNWDFSGGG